MDSYLMLPSKGTTVNNLRRQISTLIDMHQIISSLAEQKNKHIQELEQRLEARGNNYAMLTQTYNELIDSTHADKAKADNPDTCLPF